MDGVSLTLCKIVSLLDRPLGAGVENNPSPFVEILVLGSRPPSAAVAGASSASREHKLEGNLSSTPLSQDQACFPVFGCASASRYGGQGKLTYKQVRRYLGRNCVKPSHRGNG